MAKTKKSVATLGLLITPKRDGEFFHVYAEPVFIGGSPRHRADIDAGLNVEHVRHDQITSPYGRYASDYYNGLLLENFHVNSQGNNSDRDRRLYGFDVQYRNVYSLDAEGAEAYAKTLRTVKKRLSALYEKFGNPTTFGQYVLRVAAALGATRIVFRGKDLKQDGYDFKIEELNLGHHIIDRLVKDWADENKAKEVHQ